MATIYKTQRLIASKSNVEQNSGNLHFDIRYSRTRARDLSKSLYLRKCAGVLVATTCQTIRILTRRGLTKHDTLSRKRSRLGDTRGCKSKFNVQNCEWTNITNNPPITTSHAGQLRPFARCGRSLPCSVTIAILRLFSRTREFRAAFNDEIRLVVYSRRVKFKLKTLKNITV